MWGEVEVVMLVFVMLFFVKVKWVMMILLSGEESLMVLYWIDVDDVFLMVLSWLVFFEVDVVMCIVLCDELLWLVGESISVEELDMVLVFDFVLDLDELVFCGDGLEVIFMCEEFDVLDVCDKDDLMVWCWVCLWDLLLWWIFFGSVVVIGFVFVLEFVVIGGKFW